MATRTIETQTEADAEFLGYLVEHHTENENWPIVAQTVAQLQERKVGFFSRIADAVWRVYFLTPTFRLMPCEPQFRLSNALSHREKARLEADLKGL